MTPDFWIERWQKGEIGFHQEAGNDLLQKHWPSLGVTSDCKVFVPLCGKSRDMAWLAGQGHRVVGVELSPLAVDDFFREPGIEAGPTAIGGQSIVRVRARSPKQPFASVARTVTGKLPVWSGVPERRPAPGSSVMPVGRTPAARVQPIAPTPPACVNVTPA